MKIEGGWILLTLSSFSLPVLPQERKSGHPRVGHAREREDKKVEWTSSFLSPSQPPPFSSLFFPPFFDSSPRMSYFVVKSGEELRMLYVRAALSCIHLLFFLFPFLSRLSHPMIVDKCWNSAKVYRSGFPAMFSSPPPPLPPFPSP